MGLEVNIYDIAYYMNYNNFTDIVYFIFASKIMKLIEDKIIL